MRIPTDREPTHPGEMLRAEFLEPMGSNTRQKPFTFNISASTALVARQINLKSGRFFDSQRFPQWNSNLISAA